jgi:hypothetical protein
MNELPEAKDIVDWLKSQKNGTIIGYDDILSEVRRRAPHGHARDIRYITDKALRMFLYQMS